MFLGLLFSPKRENSSPWTWPQLLCPKQTEAGPPRAAGRKLRKPGLLLDTRYPTDAQSLLRILWLPAAHAIVSSAHKAPPPPPSQDRMDQRGSQPSAGPGSNRTAAPSAQLQTQKPLFPGAGTCASAAARKHQRAHPPSASPSARTTADGPRVHSTTMLMPLIPDILTKHGACESPCCVSHSGSATLQVGRHDP